MIMALNGEGETVDLEYEPDDQGGRREAGGVPERLQALLKQAEAIERDGVASEAATPTLRRTGTVASVPPIATSASGMAACPKISRNLSAGSSKFNPDKFHKTPANNAIRTDWFDSASGKAEMAPRNECDEDVLNSINKMPVENINRP